MKKLLGLIAFSMVLGLLSTARAQIPYTDKAEGFGGSFFTAETATTQGKWFDTKKWGGAGTLQVTGAGTYVIQIRGSNAEFIPLDTDDQVQVGKDITVPGIHGMNFNTRWVKAIISTYTSGTITAEFWMGQKGSSTYFSVNEKGEISTTSSGGAGLVDQGTSGVDADAWNFVARDSAGVELDLARGPAQTATEPTVIAIGDTPTLILAASANTHGAIIKNMGTAIVFIGKSGVADTTGIPLRGGVLNDDAKGESGLAEHGDDIYGIVTSGTVNIRLQVRSN